MSGKIVLFILVSSLLSTLLISAAFSLCILYGESPENFNAQVNSSTAYINVPFHYQRTSYYCGPAALEMVFDYYGEDIPQAEIADVARTIYGSGTYRDELRRAAHFSNLSTSLGDEMSGNITGYSARKIGYAAFEQHGLTIDDLKTLINKGEPVIVLMWYSPWKSDGHYRLVIGYNRTHMIMHDPRYSNKSMTYSTFLDLWEYSSNWGLWVRPWNIELQMPSTVVKEKDFEVIANITYPCSTPFYAGEYPASSCKATIELQEGMELTLGETAQHSLGSMTAGDPVQTSWSIYANETGFYNISVTVTGIVEGNVGYNYEDAIGGSCTNSLSITNETYRVHNIHTGLNYTTIQAAIDALETLDGHTIRVDAGIYHENVIVNKSLSLVGENKNNTIIDGYSAGNVIEVTANNVNITGFSIQNGIYPWNGIILYYSNNNRLIGNNVSNSYIGIELEYSSNNMLVNNTASYNVAGIRLLHSGNNMLVNNTVSRNRHGINLDASSGNILSNNAMVRNSYHFGCWHAFNNTVYLSNTADGKPIYYVKGVSNVVYDLSTNAATIYIINSVNVTVKNLKLSNNRKGIHFWNTSNSRIENVVTSENEFGIWLERSSDNVLVSNIASNNNVGIHFSYQSNSNRLVNNSIASNIWGIHFYESNSNTLVSNIISNNRNGIELDYSANSIVHHNNFIDNMGQVVSIDSVNIWDDSYPSGGNYWSNYTEVDLFSGPYQNETGSDGIGDTAHVVDENNIDHYPLMGMFSDFNAASEQQVQTICNSTISHFRFNGTAICFNVTGEDGTAGFCRTCIPRALMNGTYRVFVNGTEVSHTLLPCSNSTHNYLYFTYNHSTQEVIIIPEFPSFLLLPLFIIATLLAAILYRRKHSM